MLSRTPEGESPQIINRAKELSQMFTVRELVSFSLMQATKLPPEEFLSIGLYLCAITRISWEKQRCPDALEEARRQADMPDAVRIAYCAMDRIYSYCRDGLDEGFSSELAAFDLVKVRNYLREALAP